MKQERGGRRMGEIKNWKFVSVIAGIIFLSGCASVQIVGKPASLKSLPPIVVIGEITPANEKVKIPPEKIKEGQEILFETFKKELPEFTVLKSIQDLPEGSEDHLLLGTKIIIYHESQPQMIVTIIFATRAMSLTETEMVVTRNKEKEIIFKFHAAGAAGM
ncbi:MAG: hypothetical protein AABY26_03195, partial [Nanoarchaeota archaeon]